MEVAKRPMDPKDSVIDGSPRKRRFRASELPLTQVQRTSIDGILHTFKKKGEFDILRKKVYAQFEESDAKNSLLTSLTSLAESELERNPALLGKDRRQAAPLIEGAAERSEIYKTAEADVDAIINRFIADAEEKLREIRKMDVGQANAVEEQRRGSKSDEDYARESAIRRQAWAQMRVEEMERQRKLEEEEQRRLEVERQKRVAEEEEKERERAIEREKERKRQEEWERELEERRERKKRQDAEWERERLEKEERARKKREAEREKEIEAAALEELLREGKRLAAKSGRAEDVLAKDNGSKESALAAIMKAEKLERELAAKAGDESGNAAEKVKDDEVKEETSAKPHAENDLPGPDRSTGAGYLYKSNVWVRDGQRPKQALYKRETFGTAEKRPEPVKAAERPIPESSSRREDGQRSNSYYREEHTAGRHFHESHEQEKDKDSYETRRSAFDISSRRPSIRDRPDDAPYKASNDYDRPSRHGDDYRRSRSPSNYPSYHKQDDTKEAERRPRRHASSRSRSPSRHHHASYRERDRDESHTRSASRNRRRSRSRDPKDIDRYVPSSSARGNDNDRDRERDRDRQMRDQGRDGEYSASRGYDHPRDYARDRDRDRSKERDRERDRDYRSSTNKRPGREHREKDVDDGRDRERRGDKSPVPVQIDRYMPSTSYRAKRGELEGQAVARTHALAGSQKERKRSRSNSRSVSGSRMNESIGKESRSRSRPAKH